MAYGTKYYYQYKDLNLTDTWRIELQKKDYVSTEYAIDSSMRNTDVITDRGQDPRDISLKIIKGTEIQFNFLVKPDDLHKYDEIGRSNYKDWKLIRKKNGTQIFEGFVRPDFFSRGYIENGAYPIKIVANCGLGSLDRIDFLDTNGNPYDDRVSGITIIKRCIEAGGLPQLDFRIQLNTYETILMLSTDQALDKVTYDCRRFYDVSSGRIRPYNCHQVLKEVLKIFHINLMQQIDNYYYFVNSREVASYIHEFDYTTLALNSRTFNDLVLDITTYKYNEKGIKEYAPPLKILEVEFNNKNLGGDEGIDGTFEGPTINSFWNNVDWPTFTWGNDFGQGYLKTAFTANPTAGSGLLTFKTDPITISTLAEGDKFDIQFYFRIRTLIFDTSSGAYKPTVYIGLQKDSDPIKFSPWRNSPNVGDAWSVFNESFILESTGDYVVYFYILFDDVVYTTEMNWDYIYLSQYRATQEVTFDKVYGLENTGIEAIEKYTEDFKFGDSEQITDVGALKISDTLTTAWNRYGKSDGLSLLILTGLQILSDFQDFGTILTLSVIDYNDTIRPYHIIQLPDKPGVSGTEEYYQIISYKRDQRSETVELKVRLLNTTDATYDLLEVLLKAIDGVDVSAPPSSAVVEGGGATSGQGVGGGGYWSKNVGVYTMNGVAVQGDNSGTYDFEVYGTGYIESDLTIGGALVFDTYAAIIKNTYVDGTFTIGTTSLSNGYAPRIEIYGNFNALTLLRFDSLSYMFSMYESVVDQPIISAYTSSAAFLGEIHFDVTEIGGSVGTIALDLGATGGYEGYSIGGRVAFIHNNSTESGIYDDVNNQWLFRALHHDGVYLYYDGSVKLETKNTGVDITGVLTVNGSSVASSFTTGLTESSGTVKLGDSAISTENIDLIWPSRTTLYGLKIQTGYSGVGNNTSKIELNRTSDESILLSSYDSVTTFGPHTSKVIVHAQASGSNVFLQSKSDKTGALTGSEFIVNSGGYILVREYGGAGAYSFSGMKYQGNYSSNWGTIGSSNYYIPHVGWIYDSYLALTGGTLTGALTVQADITSTGDIICDEAHLGDVASSGYGVLILTDTSVTNVYLTGSASGSATSYIKLGELAIGNVIGDGQLYVRQWDSAGAKPVVTLEQIDVSEEMIKFETTIGTGNAIEAVGTKTLTTTHFIKVTLPGALTRYIPCGTIA